MLQVKIRFNIYERLFCTGSPSQEEAGDEAGGVSGSKMGARSCCSCGVHRSCGRSGASSRLDGLRNDSLTKSDKDDGVKRLIHSLEAKDASSASRPPEESSEDSP